MAGASNLSKSGASYTAELVDKISKPVQKIVGQLNKLREELEDVRKPMRKLSSEMSNMGKASKSLRNIDRTTSSLAKFTKATVGFGAVALAAREVWQWVKRAGQALVAFGVDAVRVAGDAIETLNAFNAVFKDLATSANNFFTEYSTRVGRSAIDMRRTATGFQSMFVGLGAGAREANMLSTSMTELATDFSSFFNLTDDEGTRRFISALAGSTEVLDRFGINIRENAAELKAQQLGFGDNIRDLTEYQKALVRLNIIYETMSKQGAVGDAIKTQQEWVNQTKALQAVWKDLKNIVGEFLIEVLLPWLQLAVTEGKNMNTELEAMRGNFKGLAQDVRTTFGAWVGGAKEGLDTLNSVWVLTKNVTRPWALFDGTNAMQSQLAFQQLVGQFTSEGQSKMTGRISKTAEAFNPAAQEKASRNFLDFWHVGMRIGVATFLEQLRNGLNKAAERIRTYNEENTKLAKQLADSVKTPLELFRESAKEIEGLFKRGFVTKQTRDRVMLKAAETYRDASKVTTQVQARTSQGGFSAGFARSAGNFAPTMDMQLKEQKSQTELLRVIAKNTNIQNVNPLAFK